MATFHKIAIVVAVGIVSNEFASQALSWPSLSDFIPPRCASLTDNESALCIPLSEEGMRYLKIFPMCFGLLLLFIGSIGLLNSRPPPRRE